MPIGLPIHSDAKKDLSINRANFYVVQLAECCCCQSLQDLGLLELNYEGTYVSWLSCRGSEKSDWVSEIPIINEDNKFNSREKEALER